MITNICCLNRGFILLLSLFVSYQNIYAQWLNASEANLKGAVHSVKMTHMKVMSEGDSIWGEPAADNDPFWFKGYVDNAYIFDREGRVVELHTYFTDDADDNKTTNTFDSSGKLIKQQFFADGRNIGSMSFEYDQNGRIVQIIRYDEVGNITDLVNHVREQHTILPLHKSRNNVWIYNYNIAGQCTQEKCLLPDGRISFRNLFFYDENGKQIRMVSFDGNNEQQSSTSYRYNELDKIKEIILITPLKIVTTRFQYDEHGNEISSHITETELDQLANVSIKELKSAVSGYKLDEKSGAFEKNDKIRSQTKTQSVYTYDEQENWIEHYYFQNGTPLFMQKRKITYWR